MGAGDVRDVSVPRSRAVSGLRAVGVGVSDAAAGGVSPGSVRHDAPVLGVGVGRQTFFQDTLGHTQRNVRH